MNMARNVYEYGREGKNLCLYKYTYGGIRIINMQIETKHKTRSAHNTGRKTCREESIHIRHSIIETGKQTRNGLGGDRGYYWVKCQGWEFTLGTCTLYLQHKMLSVM